MYMFVSKNGESTYMYCIFVVISLKKSTCFFIVYNKHLLYFYTFILIKQKESCGIEQLLCCLEPDISAGAKKD